MTYNLQHALEEFQRYRNALFVRCPQAEAQADAAAGRVLDCRTASAEKIWRVMWDKPIYANRKLEVAERLVKWAEPQMPGVWQTNNKFGPFSISRKPKHLWVDKTGKSNGSFWEETGAKVDEFQRNGIAYQFTFAMMEAGRYLREQAAKYDPPLAHYHGRELAALVDELKEGLGFNWGHITVLHFLTDLGLACKPDIHLVRTMDALGLHACDQKRPTIHEAIEMNRIIKEFLPLAYGDAGAQSLRRLDKVLMEISRQGVLPQAIYTKWPEDDDDNEHAVG